MQARIQQLDLLRFLAAMAVLLYHLTFVFAYNHTAFRDSFPVLAPIFQYGALGVHLFFLISGYVISLSLRHHTPLQFLMLRALRLYPALWVCVTITTLVYMAQTNSAIDLRQYAANMTITQAFLGISDIDLSYWTLAVEVRFYLAVFFFHLLFKRRHFPYFLAAWTLCAGIRHYYGLPLLDINFFNSELALFFIAGACFYFIHIAQTSPLIYLTLLSAMALAYAKSTGITATYNGFFPPYHFDLVTLRTILLSFFLLFALLATNRLRWLNHPSFAALGALTYPLYLLHQNIGVALLKSWLPHGPSILILTGIILFLLLAAWLVHRLVERPLARRLRPWIAARFQ